MKLYLQQRADGFVIGLLSSNPLPPSRAATANIITATHSLPGEVPSLPLPPSAPSVAGEELVKHTQFAFAGDLS
jgi:hypothetical protein